MALATMEASSGGYEQVYADLSDPDDSVRLRALRQLGDMSPGEAAFYHHHEYVADILTSPNSSKVVAEACKALGKMGSVAAEYASELQKRTKDEDDDVARAACTALGKLGPKAGDVDKDLLEIATDGRLPVKPSAIIALGQVGGDTYLKQIKDFLNNKEYSCREAALVSLAGIGPKAESAASDVAKILGEKNGLREQACQYFAAMGAKSCKDNAAKIADCVTAEDSFVREACVDLFRKLGEDAKPVAKEVQKHLGDKATTATKCAAAMSLGYAKASDASSAVEKLLSDSTEDQASLVDSKACLRTTCLATSRFPKCAAAESLAMMGETKQASKVADLLDHKQADVRACGLRALADMGSAGGKFHSKMVDMIDDDDAQVAAEALIAVGKTVVDHGTPKETVPLVRRKLQSKRPLLRKAALTALGHISSGADGACAEEVVKCFVDRCPQVRLEAVKTIPKLGLHGEVYAVDVAKKMMPEGGDTDPKVRVAAIMALTKMNERGEAMKDEIVDCLASENEAEVIVAALNALGEFGTAVEDDVLDEIATLANEDPREEVQAAANKAQDVLNKK